jgi:thiamine phosphate synthase YjbQ (UPF0047 family)
METVEVRTSRREELVNITAPVREAVGRSGVREGVAHLWSFHTTCGLTVNEGADPYRHAEGNSDSHVKTSLVNPGATLLVSDGDLVLGTWQAVFLAEFDGPRTRTVGVQVVPAG